jgi:hypothetical protein
MKISPKAARRRKIMKRIFWLLTLAPRSISKTLIPKDA